MVSILNLKYRVDVLTFVSDTWPYSEKEINAIGDAKFYKDTKYVRHNFGCIKYCITLHLNI